MQRETKKKLIFTHDTQDNKLSEDRVANTQKKTNPLQFTKQ